jgi:hypothetical protein
LHTHRPHKWLFQQSAKSASRRIAHRFPTTGDRR